MQFNNRFSTFLPADSNQSNEPRQMHNACFSYVKPTPIPAATCVHYNLKLAEQLRLSEKDCQSDWFTQLFAGNQYEEPIKPYAMCYGGHQFGHWAGQLGDGRAINLAEVVDLHGVNQTLQLKGAGLTPYSRTADGLAVLRSSIREYLCSEAMHALGIPTTRALSLILSGEKVMRDMLYDGHAQLEPGAVICRVSQSFIRFGSFEIFAFRKDYKRLKQLADFCIKYDFPHLIKQANYSFGDAELYESWFSEICNNTARLIVEWMRVGFVHGVMNTDNMSILGLTLDYGPYGWLDAYQPDWTPNTTDAQGKRYCYANQPQIAHWNLYCLANAIYPLINREKKLQMELNNFADYYQQLADNMYAKKLGFVQYNADQHKKLIADLLKILTLCETDMTIFFRLLSQFKTQVAYSSEELITLLMPAYYNPQELTENTKQQITDWLKNYLHSLSQQQVTDEKRTKQMNSVNPKFVLRNYLTYQAIQKAEQGDYTEIEKLMLIMRKPYSEQPNSEQPSNKSYAEKRPEWARVKPGASMLSCSS